MFILSNFYDNIGIHTANLKTQLKTNAILKLSQHFFFFLSYEQKRDVVLQVSSYEREHCLLLCN